MEMAAKKKGIEADSRPGAVPPAPGFLTGSASLLETKDHMERSL